MFSTIHPHLQGTVVLNVDDNDLNQLVIRKILGSENIMVISAANGEEAINKINEGLQPDAILMDLEMPVMNGFQAAEVIRKYYNPTIPIIINSGMVTGIDKFKLLKLNIVDFLQKPYSREDILQKLSKYVYKVQRV